MEKHLVEHAAQHVAVAFTGYRRLHRFGNSAAEAPRSARMFSQDLPANFGFHGGRRRYRRTVSAHHFPAERFLLIGAFHHVDLAVKAQIGTCHRKRRAPLTGSGFGGHTVKPLFLRVIGLGDGGV